MRGVAVNGQNDHGNTCLHLACIRPNAEGLCSHLIRIGKTKVAEFMVKMAKMINFWLLGFCDGG